MNAGIIATVVLPLVLGLGTLLIRRAALGRVFLVFGAMVHVGFTVLSWRGFGLDPVLENWIVLDGLGRLFLTTVSFLFIFSALYSVGFLKRDAHLNAKREAVFTGSLLCYLATMSLVTYCQHMELLWVAIEATTLASAPLIYFHRSRQSLEATWKYLMICSVGIALALFGNFFLSIASAGRSSMALQDLLANANSLQATWLKTAFIFIFVGYGTKMGLAPLHTWLPDAHSEAPSLVSALLSGCSLNCALLGILRAFQVCNEAGLGDFGRSLLLGFGLFSMGVAAVFIVRQSDFKRLLAYSSVEHMGIIATAVGLGGEAVFGGLFHLVGHSIVKAMLFLVAGNVLQGYRSKNVQQVTGLMRSLPGSGFLWFFGFIVVSGFPPFGLFTSEFVVLKSAVAQGQWVVVSFFLVFLLTIFVGMSGIFLRMLLGPANEQVLNKSVSGWQWMLGPPAGLGILCAVFGPHIPPFFKVELMNLARVLGGGL